MAEINNQKKRKRSYKVKNLELGELVEVRSLEDGFQGSWHPGVVIACDIGFRRVEYDNLLADNGIDHLIETVEFLTAKNDLTSNVCNRGRIRPQPDPREVRKQDLRYGLCVDCYYNEAWWEGVVFDHEYGSNERKIFFPDLGDELLSNVDQLRLTHDWNEVTGQWKSRGGWYFLKIMEKYERDYKFLTASLKQIWYDMKAKKEFDYIGDWPFPVQSSWRKMVEEVIEDHLRFFLDGFMKDENLIKDHTMVGEMCKNAELAIVDFQDSRPEENKQVVDAQPEALSVICSGSDGIDSSPRLELGKKKRTRWNKRNCKTDRRVWNLEPEFCPDSIDEYLLAERTLNSLTTNLRRHLLALGYEIKFCYSSNRLCYASPCGKKFYYLRKCAIFEKEKSLEEADNLNFNPQPLKVSHSHAKKRKLKENDKMISCPQQLEVDNTIEVCDQTKKRKMINLDIVPKYCPEVISEYASVCKKENMLKSPGELVDDARAHLAATGWNFWFKIKKSREEWRYDSPYTKKTYNSVRSVCRAIGNGVEMIGEEPKGLSGGELSISREDVRGVSFSKGWSKKFPRALRKFKLGKDPKRKRNGYKHCMPTPHNGHDQDQDEGFAKQRSLKMSTSFMSKKKKALGKVKNNSRVLRSSKRAQVKPSRSSQAPRSVLSWLMENNIVLAREKVQYFKKGGDKPGPEGRITNCGIICSCCSKVYSLSGFADHMGCNSQRPGLNLFFCGDDKSLVQRQLDLMHQKVRSFGEEPLERICGKRNKSWNDHICSICHYGGDLILCDRCPSSFHASCLQLQDIPDGDWFCPSCCCGICNESHFDNADKNILHCHQCERQYHAHCVKDRNVVEFDAHPTENWFCCKMCEKVHWGLQQLLGKPVLVGPNNLTLTLVKPMDYLASEHDECDVVAMADNFSKLNVALEVMHECFEPVKEPKTRRDLVEDVIFCRGSHLNRLNFKGFYTVLLERNDELITVAVLRVYGDKVAEMPLIGTRFKYRRLGMCRIVMEEIEKNLIQLGVKKLVLPAATSVLNTWTTAFGFTPVTESERSEFLSYTFLDFQDTVMCQKPLKKEVPSPLLHLSRDALGSHHRVLRNLKGKSIINEPEGNSAISEVSQEDQREGSETVDQGVLVNGSEEKSNHDDNGKDTLTAMMPAPINPENEPCDSLELKEHKIERHNSVRKIKIIKRKKAAKLRPPVSQANCSKVEVSCR